jgi:drug/metabolite transporter (DMT)-like permease
VRAAVGSRPPDLGAGAIAALAVAIASWGLSNVANRYLLLRLHPVEIVALRYSIASAFLLPLLFKGGASRWPWADLGWMALIGCFGVVGFNVPVTLGTQWLPAGTVGLLVATEPVWISIISVAVLRERLVWSLPVGLALAAAGALVLIAGHGSAAQLFGDAGARGFVKGAGFVLLGAFSWAIYAIGVRRFTHQYGSMTSTGLTVMLGTLPLLGAWNRTLLDRSAHLGGDTWGVLLFLGGACTVLATTFWNYAAARTSAARVGPWLYLVPLVSVLGGHLFLGESIYASTIAGGGMILAGVAVSQLQPRGWATETE